ncbi:MAG: hypothetical protein ACM3S4_11890 [Burkholderiales bacterium]
MIDIDKALAGLKVQGLRPSEKLRLETREIVSDAAKQRGEHKLSSGFKPVYIIASAVLAILLFALVFTALPAQAAGYYTIDINPSISVAVDAYDNVIEVSAENDDASALLSGLDVKGRRFEEALDAIIRAAVKRRYLAGGGQVLVARFGEGEGLSQQKLDAIVGGQLPDENVSTLVLNGEKEQFENAKKSGRKAGVELLLTRAREIGIEEDNLGEVIRKVKSAKQNERREKEEPEEKVKQNAEPAAMQENGSNKDKKDHDKGKSGNLSKEDRGNDKENGREDNNAAGKKDKDEGKGPKDSGHGNKDKDKEEGKHGRGGGRQDKDNKD